MEFQKTSEGFSFHQGKDNEKDIKYPNYQKGFFFSSFLIISLLVCNLFICSFNQSSFCSLLFSGCVVLLV